MTGMTANLSSHSVMFSGVGLVSARGGMGMRIGGLLGTVGIAINSITKRTTLFQ